MVVIIFIMASTIQRQNEADSKSTIAFSLLSEMTELNQRTYYYLLYKEGRAKNEWYLIFDDLTGLMKDLQFGTLEQDEVLQRIRRNLGEIREIFTAQNRCGQKPGIPV